MPPPGKRTLGDSGDKAGIHEGRCELMYHENLCDSLTVCTILDDPYVRTVCALYPNQDDELLTWVRQAKPVQISAPRNLWAMHP
jgi:hypothetical protein